MDFNAPTAEQKAEIRRRKGKITRRLKRELLAEHGIARLPKQTARDLITGAQGTGKSRAAAEGIARMPMNSVVVHWLVPTLEKAAEQAREYERIAGPDSMSSMVVRGRPAPDPNAPGKAMCPRHQVVNRAAFMGVEVERDICKGGCPLFDQCGFQAQRSALSDTETGLFVMAADYLWLPCPAPKPDIVVVDESVINKATEVVSFEPSRIVEDQKWAGGELDEQMKRRRIAVLVRDAVKEHPDRELAFLRENGVTIEDIKECVDHLRTREEARADVDGKMSDKEISDRLDQVEAREILKVLKLFRQIRREFDQPRARLNSVWFDPETRVKVNKEIERAERVFVGHVRPPLITKGTPVLALDGTGSIELNRPLFGNHMALHRYAAPRDAEVTQVVAKGFSRQSLTGCDRNDNPISEKKMKEAQRLREQVIELLSLLPGPVLLVTYKRVKEMMLDELPPHVTAAHFEAVRGLNAYEHCETVVVMGREQPSVQQVEIMTRPFTAGDPEPFIPVGEYVLRSHGRRQRNGGPNVVDVHVHPDPRCQARLEQIREAEIAQAIDRVRPVFNRRRIVLLTNLALDVTVDRALRWKDIRPTQFAIAYARHGVLPLSGSELFRCFPDLWPSQRAAKEALRRAGLNGHNPQIKYYFGECVRLIPNPIKALYRRNAQRGRSTRVLVSPDLPDPRQAVATLVGDVAEFRLELPPQPPSERQLTPLAAALSAEAHLLATAPPDERPPDGLGMAGAIRLMSSAEPARGTRPA